MKNIWNKVHNSSKAWKKQRELIQIFYSIDNKYMKIIEWNKNNFYFVSFLRVFFFVSMIAVQYGKLSRVQKDVLGYTNCKITF